jgi:hypothetical protein
MVGVKIWKSKEYKIQRLFSQIYTEIFLYEKKNYKVYFFSLFIPFVYISSREISRLELLEVYLWKNVV